MIRGPRPSCVRANACALMRKGSLARFGKTPRRPEGKHGLVRHGTAHLVFRLSRFEPIVWAVGVAENPDRRRCHKRTRYNRRTRTRCDPGRGAAGGPYVPPRGRKWRGKNYFRTALFARGQTARRDLSVDHDVRDGAGAPRGCKVSWLEPRGHPHPEPGFDPGSAPDG